VGLSTKVSVHGTVFARRKWTNYVSGTPYLNTIPLAVVVAAFLRRHTHRALRLQLVAPSLTPTDHVLHLTFVIFPPRTWILQIFSGSLRNEQDAGPPAMELRRANEGLGVYGDVVDGGGVIASAFSCFGAGFDATSEKSSKSAISGRA
jgi:hypothetical protein